MRIIYLKKEKSSSSIFKKRIRIAVECLMLVFVMCTFGMLLLVQGMREIPREEEPKEVDNIIFEIIELEAKNTYSIENQGQKNG